jgi:hypothetical protein
MRTSDKRPVAVLAPSVRTVRCWPVWGRPEPGALRRAGHGRTRSTGGVHAAVPARELGFTAVLGSSAAVTKSLPVDAVGPSVIPLP